MKRSLLWCLALSGLTACAQQTGGPAKSTQTAAGHDDMLTAYHWQLERAIDDQGTAQPQWIRQNGNEDGPLDLTFKDQRVSVSGLCNKLGASYAITGTQMRINQVVGTMRLCPDESLMQYEQAVGQRLPEVSAWRVKTHPGADQQPSLTLGFNDGSQWILQGKPTHETLYGSSADIVFLEVAAQTVPCSHPLTPNKQCLNVRTVDYDASGLKQGQGQWQAFYDDIEGYRHEPGVRNVLRLKRYTRRNVPADASRYAYVLDLTVESENTR